MRRVRKRATRPLLQTADPEGAMRRLIDDRYPVYAEADVTVQSRDAPHETIIEEIMDGLERHPATQGEFKADMTSLALPPDTTRVHVKLGARAYDILIGPDLIAHAGEKLARLAPGAAASIVTDSNVGPRWLAPLQASLDGAGVRHDHLVLPAGRSDQGLRSFRRALRGPLEARMERGDFLVALGGGVVGDLAGFAAATSARGACASFRCRRRCWRKSIPRLAAKPESTRRMARTLIGAFHQPSLVLADTADASTLCRCGSFAPAMPRSSNMA